MSNFKSDYNKCLDKRKEVYWNVCKYLKKDNIMYYTLKNNYSCIAWKGYKYDTKSNFKLKKCLTILLKCIRRFTK